VHQYETSLLQNDLWRDLSGEGQKGVKVSAVSEKIRKLAGRGSRRAGKGKGPKAGRGRARNFTDEVTIVLGPQELRTIGNHLQYTGNNNLYL
jgi:hypothetical protein